MNQLVRGEQADSELPPRLGCAKFQQVVEIDREMGSVESSNADVHKPGKDAASVVAGARDGDGKLGKRGVAKENRILGCACDHEPESPFL
jgi:hypothetical protein